MTVCRRCGTTAEPIDTVSIRVNEITEYFRAALCTDCRAVVRAVIEDVLAHPGAA